MSLTNNSNINPNPNYCLLFSTSTFIFPIMYAYKKQNKYLAMYSTLALFGSLNYWRNPCIGYRKNMDLVTSKLSALAYFYYGYNNINGFYPLLFGWSNLLVIYKLYDYSCKKFDLHDSNWIYYHALFHLYTTLSKVYIIFWE